MRFLIHIIILFISMPAFAQHAPLYFRNLNEGNGLSHNKVNCIIQDRRGFTWIGTDDGLNRYDGFRFVVYKTNAAGKSSVSGNIITDILEDKQGILWIATADGGLTRFDYSKSPEEQFRAFKHRAGDSSSIPVNISVNNVFCVHNFVP